MTILSKRKDFFPMSSIDNTIVFVKNKLKEAEGGHDWFHIERV